MAYNPDQFWHPGKVRVRASARDKYDGMRGKDYIAARGLDKKKKRIEPDRAALEIAHSLLRTSIPLDDMLADTKLRPVIENVARQHMRRREQFDLKKLQAGDDDD